MSRSGEEKKKQIQLNHSGQLPVGSLGASAVLAWHQQNGEEERERERARCRSAHAEKEACIISANQWEYVMNDFIKKALPHM